MPEDPVQAVVDEIEAAGGKATAFEGDLSNQAVAEACVQTAVGHFTKLNPQRNRPHDRPNGKASRGKRAHEPLRPTEKVANVYLFLASDEASYVMGATRFVDAGATLSKSSSGAPRYQLS